MNNKKTDPKIVSPQILRKRKMQLVLPLIVLPFITMLFWALGGGSVSTTKTDNFSELMLHLPDPLLKEDKSENKLSFYEKADRDSLRRRQQIKDDPLLQLQKSDTLLQFESKHSTALSDSALGYKDPNEEKVYQKLAQLNQQLNTAPLKSNSGDVSSSANKTSTDNNDDVERLEQLVQQMNKDSESGGPEMNNLNGMMEKILDIQHPERVKERQEEKNTQTQENIFQVNKKPTLFSVTLLDTIAKKPDDSKNFFGLAEESNSNADNAIEAVVHENQTLVNGAIIKLRLLNDISIDGNMIPKDNFVFGSVSLNGERLEVTISSIRVNHSLFPVKLSVYDIDGLPGIYIPGAITRDVAKQSLDNATQMIGISSMDPSVKAQAATAGIEAAKTLLSKKAKLIKVTVKAGYKVLLQ